MALITPPIKNIKITDAKPSANELVRYAEVRRKSTISQVTEPLKEEDKTSDISLQTSDILNSDTIKRLLLISFYVSL